MGTDPPWLCYPGINVKELSSQLSSCCHQEYELGGGTVGVLSKMLLFICLFRSRVGRFFFGRQLFSLAPVRSSAIVFLRQPTQSHGLCSFLSLFYNDEACGTGRTLQASDNRVEHCSLTLTSPVVKVL
jgi:hypothetical protein